MLIGDLLPAALAAWMPRRAAQTTDVQFSRPIEATKRAVPWSAVALPRGMAWVDRETQTALTAVNGYARSRGVELQVAVEPGLVVLADSADYQKCLRGLLPAAIGRASSGVLVTAMRQADGVEIAVLDDGTAAADVGPDGSAPGGDDWFVPAGGTLHADYHKQRGTTIRVCLPRPDGPAVPSDADADDAIPAYAIR